MKQSKQDNSQYKSSSVAGMSLDDISMLTSVLQQVKGVSGVSGSLAEIMAPVYEDIG